MRPDVELRLPVDSAYVSVLRATTVSLAARLDFTIDDIEDLRIAVGEASAMVLPSADPELPEEDGFAWQVLSALTTETSTTLENGVFSVTLTMNSTVNV